MLLEIENDNWRSTTRSWKTGCERRIVSFTVQSVKNYLMKLTISYSDAQVSKCEEFMIFLSMHATEWRGKRHPSDILSILQLHFYWKYNNKNEINYLHDPIETIINLSFRTTQKLNTQDSIRSVIYALFRKILSWEYNILSPISWVILHWCCVNSR